MLEGDLQAESHPMAGPAVYLLAISLESRVWGLGLRIRFLLVISLGSRVWGLGLRIRFLLVISLGSRVWGLRIRA